MISFNDYSEGKLSSIASKVSKKLKISKDKALELLVKAQQKGIDPLKWQSRLSFLATMTGEYDPKLDERSMSYIQKLAQMQHYWDNLWSIASEVAKKKNMLMRFGIKNIKLDKEVMLAGNIQINDNLENFKKIADIIDISGGLETSGLKDISKIEIFLNKIKNL